MKRETGKKTGEESRQKEEPTLKELPKMPATHKSRIDILFSVIQTILTALLLIGVYFAYLTLKSDHDQRRRIYTMHLYEEWRQVLDLGEARQTLEKIRSDSDPDQLNADDLKAIAIGKAFNKVDDKKKVIKTFTEDEVLKMRQHIVSILNLFEQIAVADREYVGNSEMIRRYFKDVIINNRKRLEPFVHGWVENKKREGWKPLDDVIQKNWKEELPTQPPLP